MKSQYTKQILDVITHLQTEGVRMATCYVNENLIVRATRKSYKGKFDKYSWEIILTIGKPNFNERKFIKDCKKAGVPFPLKKVQIKFIAKKKK